MARARMAAVTKMRIAPAQMTAGFRVGGAACFESTASCCGFRSSFVGNPAA